MSKIDEAKQILKALQVPEKLQSELCCYVLLAMAGIKQDIPWSNASNAWIRIHDIISFTKANYDKDYAENSRETVRKQALHNFRNAAFIEDNGTSTNSPNYSYRLTPEMLTLIRSFDKELWAEQLQGFLKKHEALITIYSSKRAMLKIPIKINSADFTLSPGRHNQLQKAIMEELAPRFAPHAECLYLGDTTERDLVKNEAKLTALHFNITLHDKMPDAVLYSEDKNWLYFIEAVTSVGPMSPQRILEIEAMTREVSCGRIYITAFPDFQTYKKFVEDLAWETEVWIASAPDHMIHLNGLKLLEPRSR